MSDLYQDIIIDEAKHPAHFGELKSADKTSTQYNASCGDVVSVFIKLSEDKTTLTKINWTGEGCTISIAAMSLLTRTLEGKKVAQILKLGQAELLELLHLDDIAPGRIKCLNIGLKTIQKALQ